MRKKPTLRLTPEVLALIKRGVQAQQAREDLERERQRCERRLPELKAELKAKRERLPKREYFQLRLKQAEEAGLTHKADYYRSRLEQMPPTPPPSEPQPEYKWVFSWLDGGWNWTEGRDWKHGLEEFRKRGFGDDSIATIDLSTVRKVSQDEFDGIWNATYMD